MSAIHRGHHKAVCHVSETRNSYNHSHLNNYAVNLIKIIEPARDHPRHVPTCSETTTQNINITCKKGKWSRYAP
jgi:hypothetical protein